VICVSDSNTSGPNSDSKGDAVPAPPLEDALFEERWEPRALVARSGDADHRSRARTWLILADTTGVGEALTARLRANGERVTVARWGSAWRQHDAHIELRAGERGDMDRLLAATSISAGARLDHVVHLWSLDTRLPSTYSDPATAAAALDAAETLAVTSARHLAQALVGAGSSARLWFTTRGTHAVSPHAVSPHVGNPHRLNEPAVSAQVVDVPAMNTPTVNTPTVNLLAPNAFQTVNNAPIEIQQAAVNGLALTIGQEHPELRCTTIDLDRASRAPSQVTSLTAELLADDVETRVAWRRGTRYAARHAAARWPRESALPTAVRDADTADVADTANVADTAGETATSRIERTAREEAAERFRSTTIPRSPACTPITEPLRTPRMPPTSQTVQA
jgi:hypothetical protein